MNVTTRLVILLLLGIAPALVSCSGEKEEREEKDEKPPMTAEQIQGSLIRQLIMMAEQEQQARDVFDSVVNEKGWRSPEGQEALRNAHLLDSVNMVQLEEMIGKYGWPGRTKVGAEAAMAAFVILQHASVEKQEQYLPILETAAAKGDVERFHLAMLQDRILMRRELPQKYGTQLWNDPSNGKLGLYPIEDSANVDLRRAEVGLPPLREYIRGMGIDPDSLSQRTKTTVTIEPVRRPDTGK
jgi:hypothetical protein